jgi:hypothetical protein
MEQATTSKPTTMYIFWPGSSGGRASCFLRPPTAFFCFSPPSFFLAAFSASSFSSRRPPACSSGTAEGVCSGGEWAIQEQQAASTVDWRRQH